MSVYTPDHPHFFHVMMGGRPWSRPGAEKIERMYFDQFSSRGADWFTQGREEYKRQGPAQFPELSDAQIAQFPGGYYDIATDRWVPDRRLAAAWPGDSYDAFMRAAIVRRTFAPMLPPRHVTTRDGLLMEPGLEVLFVGGKIHRRHHWDVSHLLGRRMIAWHRFGAWDHGPDGKWCSYGDKHVRVRENAPHHAQKVWCVVPADDRPFIIPGRSFDAEMSALYIDDPEASLVTIDGRRIAPVGAPPRAQIKVPA